MAIENSLIKLLLNELFAWEAKIILACEHVAANRWSTKRFNYFRLKKCYHT